MTGLYHFFKTAGASLLLAALAGSVWYYGSATADAVYWLVMLLTAAGVMGLLTLLFMPKLMRSEINPLRLGLFGLFLLASMAFAYFQMTPHSPEMVRTLSPHIGEMAEKLLPIPGSEEEQVESSLLTEEDQKIVRNGWPRTLSVQPDATRQAFPLLAISAMSFLSAGIFFRSGSDRRVFWFLIMINGAVLALEIFLYRTGADFGLMKKIWPAAGCPPYVNRNNAAGYIVLCLGPALGFLASGMTEALEKVRRENHLSYAGYEMNCRKNFRERLADSVFELADSFSHRLILRLLAVTILMAGAAVTLSRGGTLAALFAFLTALCLLIRTQASGKTVIAAGLALCIAFFLISFGGMTEKIQDRFSEVSENVDSKNISQSDSRMVQWKAALSTSRDYRWRGSGYGTYPLANRVGEVENRVGFFFAYAENQAVQTILESGWFGILSRAVYFALIVWFIIRLTRPQIPKEAVPVLSKRRLYSDGIDRPSDAMLFGLGMASVLAGQAVAASFDFGLCLAANAVLFAALCGNFVSFSDKSLSAANPYELMDADWKSGENKNRIGTALIAAELVLVLAALIGSEQILRRSLADEEVLAANKTGLQFDEIDVPSLTLAIDALKARAEESPENPVLHQHIAQLLVLRARYRLFLEWMEQTPDQARTTVWNNTSLEPLHQRIMTLVQAHMSVGPKMFRETPALKDDLPEAMRHVLIARRLAPLEPDIHTLYGLLLPLVSDSPNLVDFVAASAERAVSVAPYDLRVQYESGILLLLAGEDERACIRWRDVLPESPELLNRILEPLLSMSKPDSLARRLDWVLPDDFALLENVFQYCCSHSRPEGETAVLAKMENALRREEGNKTPRTERNRARWHYLAGRNDEACACYQAALEGNSQQAAWHAEYADLLIKLGNYEEGISEYRSALVHDPGNHGYEDRLKGAEKTQEQNILDPPELRPLFQKKEKKKKSRFFEYETDSSGE